MSFVVDKTGMVSNVKILRGVDKYLDAEAVREFLACQDLALVNKEAKLLRYNTIKLASN